MRRSVTAPGLWCAAGVIGLSACASESEPASAPPPAETAPAAETEPAAGPADDTGASSTYGKVKERAEQTVDQIDQYQQELLKQMGEEQEGTEGQRD